MDYSRLLVFPPVWFAAASVLVGAAASRLTRRSRRTRPDGRPDRTARWVLVCVYLSLAVGCATVGLLGPAARSYLNRSTLVACAAVAVLALPACRFPKSVGIPALVLAAAAVVSSALFLRAITAFTGETEIATVRVLSRKEGRMTLELTPAAETPAVVEMEGDYFAPIVKVVIFDDVLVFLGARTWYRFEGLTSFRLEREGSGFSFRQAGSGYILQRPAGMSESLYRALEKLEGRVPAIKSVQVEMDLKRVEETAAGRSLDKFSIRVQNDGGVQIVRLP